MFLLIAAMMGCGGPDQAALSTCRSVPGLAVDADTLDRLSSLVVESELQLWRDAEPTMGMGAVDAATLVDLRAATTCEIEEAANAGPGRWAVTVKRTSPTLALDGTLGEADEHTYEWQAISDDGIRIQTGLSKHVSMRASAVDALGKEDFKRVATLWSTIHRGYGDPLTLWDLNQAQRSSAEHNLAKGKLVTAKFDRIDQVDRKKDPKALNQAVAVVHNGAPRDIADVEVSFTFTVDGKPKVVVARSGAVGQAADLEVQAAIPAKAVGQVEVRVVRVHLPLRARFEGVEQGTR